MSIECPSTYNQQQVYVPPSWAKDILHQPSTYVQLAIRPTPIHSWMLPGVPEQFQVSVKRDDMTGSTLSGNKVRKLEFLLADALQKGCDTIIACGGIQSNCARASAVATRQLGLQAHLVLGMEGDIDVSAVGCHGNVLLSRAVGATICLVPPLPFDDGGSMPGLQGQMENYKKKLEGNGLTPYLIPVGGSNTVGAWGYIEAFRELMSQGLHDLFDDVVVPIATGGTLSGLAIANYLTGSKLRIHGVCVCDNASYFHAHVRQQLNIFGISTDSMGKSLNIVDIIEGYEGMGYGRNTEEELVQLREITCATGVTLDPVYTLKGVRGMLGEMKANPARFQGSRVLYIHTGGIYGLYDGKVGHLLQNSASTSRISDFKNEIPD